MQVRTRAHKGDVPLQSDWEENRFPLASTAEVGLFRINDITARSHWIVVSSFLELNSTQRRIPSSYDDHNAILQRYEAANDWTVDWVGETRLSPSWRAHAKLEGERSFAAVSFSLNRAVMDGIYQRVGEPRRVGRWMAERLLPRALPGAIRMDSQEHLQLWIAL